MPKTSVTLTLNGTEYTVKRATLKLWLALEEQKDKIKQSAESGHGLATAIHDYISAFLDIDTSDFPWYEVVFAFSKFVSLNSPSFEFPFLKSAIEDQKVGWDYEGRTWYIWVNLLSSKGWTIEYISEMDIDDAIGIAQEIAIEKQLELETQWAMSEKSVEYDKQGKGKFRKLDRPSWMETHREVEIVKIPKSMMPQGLVLQWSRDEATKPH